MIGTSIGNSLIWDNGTNVGIGNTNTSYTLDVSGTGRFTSGVAIGAGTQAINADAELTLRDGVAFVGLDFKSARTSGSIGGLRFFNTSSDSDPASQMLVETDGKFVFYNGTLGAQARMTISSAGNVGIGTSSPTAKLQITNTSAGAATVAAFLINESGSTSTEVRLGFAANLNNDIASNRYSYISAINTSGSNGQALTFATNETGNSAVERMRITSGGNVGIGTSSPSKLFTVVASADGQTAGISGATYGLRFDNGGSFAFGGSTIHGVDNTLTATYQILGLNGSQVIFGTGGTERMRITSGGNVGVGETNPSNARFYVTSDGSALDNMYIVNTNASAGTNNSVVFRRVANTVGTIQTTLTTTSYNTSSDYRLKQDFKNYNGLNLVLSIKTYDYEWKMDNTRMYGVLAHELSEVIPYAVSGEKDGEEMQGVDYSKIVPVLVKAIQEQQALITSLQSQINELKNK
jgi:hypothetical protein